MQKVTLYVLGGHPTLKFAAQQLQEALLKLMGREGSIIVAGQERYDAAQRDALWLGLAEHFPPIPRLQVEEPAMDDAVAIEVEGMRGIIAGGNPRSVLLAVYRYLTELGFRWVRPGADGETVPEPGRRDAAVSVRETASYRHRGICIEGAASYENVADLIDWAPKVGLNSYFIQFKTPFTFFDRWYSHRSNPLLKPEPIEAAEVRQFVSKLREEIKKRDLIYHAVGHGWTCEPLGIAGLGWDLQQEAANPDIVPYLAKVNGKREIWKGVPFNTNLCYSNPKVRQLMINDITQYLQANEDVDLLHMWLADDVNNHCECESCREAIPSDFYVRLLNELDERLTLEQIGAKIVFLAYVDLLWPPEKETFHNPDRFILMFAPITRTYSRSFQSARHNVQLPAYERNKLQFSKEVAVNLGLLRGWKKVFSGDSFDFDYHYMWDHFKDPGGYSIAALLSEDIKNLRTIELNGYMSCQVQRAFFPTGLGMYVMGRTLWNEHAGFEQLAEEYFHAAFGAGGAQCHAYLARLSELFDPPYLRKEKEQLSPDNESRFAQAAGHIAAFRPVIEANMKLDNACQAQSWRYLHYHAELCALLAKAFSSRAGGRHEQALQEWQLVKAYAQQIEPQVQPVFDVFEFILTMEGQHFCEEKFDGWVG